MATAKQIAANRANAQRSTGPTTAMGKATSSRNAYRHGLSSPLPLGQATWSEVAAIAPLVAPENASADELSWASDFANAQLELWRIRKVRSKILMELDVAAVDGRPWQRLASIDRYERYAHTRRRRAALNLETTSARS